MRERRRKFSPEFKDEAVIHRGGLRADVLTDGHIGTGATIKTID